MTFLLINRSFDTARVMVMPVIQTNIDILTKHIYAVKH